MRVSTKQFVNSNPKHVYNGNTVVKLSAWTAAIIFNEGFSPILKIYEGLGIDIGNHAANFAKSRDHIRLTKAKMIVLNSLKKEDQTSSRTKMKMTKIT